METVSKPSIEDIAKVLDRHGLRYWPYKITRDPETGKKDATPLGHSSRPEGGGMPYEKHKALYDEKANTIALVLDKLVLLDLDVKEGAPTPEELKERYGLGEPIQRHPDRDSMHWLFRDDPVLASSLKNNKARLNFEGLKGVDVLRADPTLVYIDVEHKVFNLDALANLPPLPEALEKALRSDIQGREASRRTSPKRETGMATVGLTEAAETLSRIDANCNYEKWVNVLMGIHAEFGDTDEAVELADTWSATAPADVYAGYDAIAAKIASFGPDGDVTWGSVVHHAGGYEDAHTPFTLLEAQMTNWDWFDEVVQGCQESQGVKASEGVVKAPVEEIGFEADSEANLDDKDHVAADNEFLVDGLIEEGICIFSGEKGVGKTSAFLPIAAVMAGLMSTEYMTATDYRQVYYLTEDIGQAFRIRKAMWQRGEFGNIPYSDVCSRLKIQPARRGPPKELVDRMRRHADDVVVHYTDAGEPFEVRPVFFVDTVNANISKPENVHDPVSALMALLKESLNGMSLFLVHHTAKRAAGQKTASMTAHGEQAWESESTQSGILVKNEHGERMMHVTKHRVAGDVPVNFIMESEQSLAQLRNRRGRVREAAVYYSKARPVSEQEAVDMQREQRERKKNSKFDLLIETLFKKWPIGSTAPRKDVEAALGLTHNNIGQFEDYVKRKGLIDVSIQGVSKHWTTQAEPYFDVEDSL